MKLFSVNITNFKIDGGAMFGVVPKVLWQKQYPADENNLCNWALRSLLIESGNRVILIDNGFGDKQSDKYMSHFYLNDNKGLEKALGEHGYKTSDITDMLLTHLHYDHCGGGIKFNENRTSYVLAFPNAQYWVSKMQWETAMNPNEREKDSFLEENLIPMMDSGRLNFIEEDTELFPGFSVRIYNGHTQGQLIPFINIKDRADNDTMLVFVADLLPSVAHIPLPWIMSYDVLPMDTLKEKEEFLKEAEENNYVLFFQHDLYNECCNLTKTPKGIRAKDKFLLSEMISA